MTNIEIDNEIEDVVNVLMESQQEPTTCVELVYVMLVDLQVRLRQKRLAKP